MAIPQALESTAAAVQDAQGDAHVAHGGAKLGRLMVGQHVPALLTPAELRAFTGIDRTTFRKLQLAGALDFLVVDLGPRRFYSGPRFLRLIDQHVVNTPAAEERAGEGGRRFLAAARRAANRRNKRHDARHDMRLSK